jgi:hypothetical protein
MMWKRTRNEAAAPVEVKSPEATENSANVPLNTGSEQMIWNLEEVPRTTFHGDIVEAYKSIEAHVAKHSEELDYYAFDLNHKLVKEDEEVSRLALTEHEAWDLSVALVQEMAARKDSEEKFKKIIVVVNDTLDLLQNTNPEDADLYMQFRHYMQTVEADGANHGIHVLYA